MINSKQHEKIQPFKGEIAIYEKIPFDKSHFPKLANSYLDSMDDAEPYYFVAKENSGPLGFAVVEVDENNNACFTYRYVSAEHRRRGIGQQLRDRVYDWLKEKKILSIESGINNVVKIIGNGAVPNLDTKDDGGWRSYLSMTRSKTPGQLIRHKIIGASILKNGLISLTFETFVEEDAPKFLPDNSEDLIKLLFDDGVFPRDISIDELLKEAEKNQIIYCVNGKIMLQSEWLQNVAK